MQFGKVDFGNAMYIGEVQNGMAHGYGRIIFQNGDVYIGQMKNNCMTGIGVISTAKQKSLGNFVNGKREGKCGTFYKDTQNTFIGDYRNDLPNGMGCLAYNHREVLFGNFANGLAHGTCIYADSPCSEWASGTVIEADYRNGKQVGNYLTYAKHYSDWDHGTYSFYAERAFDTIYSGKGVYKPSGENRSVRIGTFTNFDYDTCEFSFQGAFVGSWNGPYGLSIKWGDMKVYGDGEIYVGPFLHGKKSGRGIWCPDGPEVERLYIGWVEEPYDTKSGEGFEICTGPSFYYGGTFFLDAVTKGYSFSEDGNYTQFFEGQKPSDGFARLETYQGQLNRSSSYSLSSSASFSAPSQPRASSNRSASSDGGAAPRASKTQTSTPEQRLAQKLKAYDERMRQAQKEEQERKEDAIYARKREERRLERERWTPREKTEFERMLETYEFEKGSQRGVLKALRAGHRGEDHRVFELPSSCYDAGTAFRQNPHVLSVTFASGEKAFLQEGAFQGCITLEKVDFSKRKASLFSIPKDAFSGCETLKTLLLPDCDAIELCDKSAFDGSPCVTFVRNGETMDRDTFIGKYLVQNMAKSQTHRQEKTRKQLKTNGKDTVDFEVQADGSVLLTKILKNTPDVIIPEGVTDVSATPFDSRKKTLKSVVFPSTLRHLRGKEMFYYFRSLHCVDLGKTQIKEIPEKCFSNTSLSDLSLPDTVETIGKGAFAQCRIEEVKLNNISQVPESAFWGARRLKYVEIKKAKEIKAGAFSDCDSLERVVINKNGCNIDPDAFSTMALRGSPSKKMSLKLVQEGDELVIQCKLKSGLSALFSNQSSFFKALEEWNKGKRK